VAPEVILLTGANTKSDIWSLGCTVVELLTGNPPYFDLSPMQALFNIVEDEHPPIPSNLSKETNHFLSYCFTKDPKKRFTADVLLQHPWIQSAQGSFSSYDEVHNIIKKHNQSRLPLDGKSEDKDHSILPEEKGENLSPIDDLFTQKNKSDHRKMELLITEKNAGRSKKNVRQDLIQAILTTTQERDILNSENEELRQQLLKLEQELQTLKKNNQ